MAMFSGIWSAVALAVAPVMMVWAWAAEMMCRWAGVVPSPFVVFMVAAAELSVRRLRVVLRMVVRKRIFEWKRWEGCLRTRAFVYSRQLAVYSSANVVEDVGKGDVDNGWRFEISRSFLSLELALPSRRVLHYLY